MGPLGAVGGSGASVSSVSGGGGGFSQMFVTNYENKVIRSFILFKIKQIKR